MFKSMDNFFGITRDGSTFKKEVVAGFTTFMAMAYILAVHPNIIGNPNFAEPGQLNTLSVSGVFIATAIAAGFASLLMGVFAKLPIGLAPGMGTNFFFAFVIIAQYKFTSQEALALTMVSGICFFLVSLSGIRELIIRSIPASLQAGISVAIGFFITTIGLQFIGVIGKIDEAGQNSRVFELGDLHRPATMLGMFTIVLILFLMYKKVFGALFIGMLVSLAIAIVVTQTSDITLVNIPSFSLGSFVPDFGDYSNVFGQAFSGFPQLADGFSVKRGVEIFIVIFTLFFVDFTNSAGMLIAVANKSGLVEEDGNIKNSKRCLMVDSIGTTVGSVLGTSSVNSFIESLSGIEVGGRTGLTSSIVGILFLLSIFLSPIFLMFNQTITGPAVIMIGILMFPTIATVDFNDKEATTGVFAMILIMTLTLNIAYGIAIGFILYTVLMVFNKRYKEVPLPIYILDIFFVVLLYVAQ